VQWAAPNRNAHAEAYIRTDAPINHGDSGGPLINSAGEIVGLNTFIMSESGGNEGMGFAIPSTMVRWVYEQLRAKGQWIAQ
jgi:serine protease Do